MKKTVNIFDKILNPATAKFDLEGVIKTEGKVSSVDPACIHGATYTLYDFDVLKGTMKSRKVCFEYNTYVPSTFAGDCAREWYRLQEKKAAKVYSDTLTAIAEAREAAGEEGLSEDHEALRNAFVTRCELLLSALKPFKEVKVSMAVANLIRAEVNAPVEAYPSATVDAYTALQKALAPCAEYGFHAGDTSATMKTVKSALQTVVNTLWDESDRATYRWNVNATMAQAVVHFLYQGEGRDRNGEHTSKFVNLDSGKVLSLVVSTLYHCLQDKGFKAIAIAKAKKGKPDDCPTFPNSVGEAD